MPTTAVPVCLSDLVEGAKSILVSKSFIESFERAFSEYIGAKYAFLVNSGTTAFYVILKALSRLSGGTEVLLPAYTVPTLTLPIWKAGLLPKLCDVSMETFNMDPGSLQEVVSEKTLCVVPVHMFGFPCELDSILKIGKDRNIFVFEDAAQATGATIDGEMVGTIGDVGCFSLCRGKNFSTYTGGIIVTNSKDLADVIEKERDNLPGSNLLFRVTIPLKLTALAYAMRPTIYGIFYPFIVPFKSITIHESFEARQYTEFQSAVGLSLLRKLSDCNRRRYENGMSLYKALKDNENILLPRIIPGTKPVFNHLPVVFKDARLREEVQMKLWEPGIDTARMYLKPIHRIYDLGYDTSADPFPNASYLAQGLVTLPTHPFVEDDTLETIVRVFEEIA